MLIKRIRTLRLQHNLTQTDVVRILHISIRSYSHYETGSRSVPIEILIALCDYYRVSLDYMVGRSNKIGK